jgi:hypothetical protein
MHSTSLITASSANCKNNKPYRNCGGHALTRSCPRCNIKCQGFHFCRTTALRCINGSQEVFPALREAGPGGVIRAVTGGVRCKKESTSGARSANNAICFALTSPPLIRVTHVPSLICICTHFVAQSICALGITVSGLLPARRRARWTPRACGLTLSQPPGIRSIAHRPNNMSIFTFLCSFRWAILAT